ncbi:ABC transporter ATP-binding protein [Paludibaculum fermentans]|uniref:ABC transporter ATP-binding protein n=1 Tax=Paludibaculum fermentans TaxID=1473598 RepID=A0A7S7SKL0_PALFE|nr:ABC transporter ATP-binding protein [Paludibaculum fermentans]QOY87833.1 ABC transporter ATP-binding protein [Paludibaculum fermentans]
MGHVLELHGLSKHFPNHVALDDLSLAIDEGEFFSLLGPSGCGKTTTLRLIAGFEAPSRGEILLRGEPQAALPPHARKVSTVFQNYALFPHLTVRQNIEFGLRYNPRADARESVRECIEMMQLDGKQDRKPAQLSGGEKQRVALARSLVLRPDVLLLDEPLSALDPNLRKQVRTELKALQRRVGITFIFITHDQEEALSVSDRIALLYKGKLEQLGTPRELYLTPRTRFAAGFLGAVNWVNGVGVRPESTRLATEQPREEGIRSVSATVQELMFLGNCLHIETRTNEGQTIVAEVSREDCPYERGQAVHVFWGRHDEIRCEPS